MQTHAGALAPWRTTRQLLVLKRACAEFAAVRGEEEAFRVVGEYNRLGDAYAPDPDGAAPAVDSTLPPSLDAPLEPPADADSPTVEVPLAPEPETEPPALASHAVSEWIARIGLGHAEGTLQEKIYSDPNTAASFSGPKGLQTGWSLSSTIHQVQGIRRV